MVIKDGFMQCQFYVNKLFSALVNKEHTKPGFTNTFKYNNGQIIV